MKERYVFVDILKGAAILMIVYGHIIPGSIPVMTKYISTFHIPLFFFVSGLLFNDEKYGDKFPIFVKERTKGLLVPFLSFSILVAVGYFWGEDNYLEFLYNLLTMGWGGYALWFIPVLFFVELGYYPLAKVAPSYRLLILLGIALLSYLSSMFVGMAPFNILLTFCGIWFYGIGNLVRKWLVFISSLGDRKIALVILLGGALSLVYLPITGMHPEWFVNKIPSMVYYLSPLFATVSMVCLSILIERHFGRFVIGFFATCGKQSFIILAFHQIIVMIVGQHLPSKLTIIIMFVSLTFLVWFIPKYLPWMLGKSYTK